MMHYPTLDWLRGLIIIGILVGVVSFEHVAQGVKLFAHPNDGLTLELPDDWEEIAQSELQMINAKAAEFYPERKRPAIHYGYRKQTTNESAFQPLLVIQVSYLGYCPDLQFIQREITRYRTDPMEIGNPDYDSDLGAYVALADIKLDGTLLATNLIAFFPTKSGLMKVFCYSSTDDIKADPEILRKMVSAVQIDKKQRPVVANKSIGRLALCIAALAILALVLWRAKPSQT